jgi:hypothetical protein
VGGGRGGQTGASALRVSRRRRVAIAHTRVFHRGACGAHLESLEPVQEVELARALDLVAAQVELAQPSAVRRDHPRQRLDRIVREGELLKRGERGEALDAADPIARQVERDEPSQRAHARHRAELVGGEVELAQPRRARRERVAVDDGEGVGVQVERLERGELVWPRLDQLAQRAQPRAVQVELGGPIHACARFPL